MHNFSGFITKVGKGGEGNGGNRKAVIMGTFYFFLIFSGVFLLCLDSSLCTQNFVTLFDIK